MTTANIKRKAQVDNSKAAFGRGHISYRLDALPGEDFEKMDQAIRHQLLLDVQANSGYHPAGYGGPWKVGIRPTHITWESAANCE